MRPDLASHELDELWKRFVSDSDKRPSHERSLRRAMPWRHSEPKRWAELLQLVKRRSSAS